MKKEISQNELFNGNRCGVCNEDIPLDMAQMMRKESDGSFTSYHLSHEFEANRLKPCEDCGYHRKFCTECAEPIFSE